jgi:eukaryotic-like serine/threonine-protein kinase
MGADLAEEEQFGPYLVYERLGIGGMATVHRALERGIEGFERIVALKRLLPHLAEDGSFIKSFVREAKLASLLNHVNIVQIYELGRVGTEYFISMEYIDGRDIRRILRHARKVTGPPPIHVTVGLLLQLCEALDYAHTRCDDEGTPLRLVHRDISPSNLLVTVAGHIKVIDFGIARAQSAQLRTQTGRVKGKLAYMAPEAIAGRELDARSDLFAVGVIAHELLTARPLFASKNEYQTLIKVQRGDIMPPSTFNQAVPAELDAIVLRALARDPDERFGGAGEMRDELLDMRRRYNLMTGHRDVSQWLEWAFQLEPPSGAFAPTSTIENTGSNAFKAAAGSSRHITPKPRKEDEDAVEIAWGLGHEADDGAPVVLDDVPDVSDKLTGAMMRQAPEELDDDIPPPQPSHGPPARSSKRPHLQTPTPSFGDTSSEVSSSVPSLPPPPNPSRPQLTPPRSRPASTNPPALAAATLPRARTVTSPNSSIGQVRNSTDRHAAVPVPPTNPSSPTPGGGPPFSPPAQNVRSSDRIPMATGSSATPPPIPNVRASQQMTIARDFQSEPHERPSDPGSSVPRAAVALTGLTDLVDSADPANTEPRMPALPAVRFKTASSQQHEVPSLPDMLSGGLTADAPPARPKRMSSVSIGSNIVARKASTNSSWLVVLLLIAGVLAAGAGAMYLLRSSKSNVVATEPKKEAPRVVGTIKVMTEPTDAEIVVQGKPAHTGSPWVSELEPGVYQIQVRREGYKARLTNIELSANETQTLIVPLEKLVGDEAATLLLSSTPSGLEAILDGQPLKQRTPIKMPIKPGRHTIVLRQNGVEVWRHEVEAQPNVDYDFNPSMSAEKRAERAQRAAQVVTRIETPSHSSTSDKTESHSSSDRTVEHQPASHEPTKPSTTAPAPAPPPPPQPQITQPAPPVVQQPPAQVPAPPPVAITPGKGPVLVKPTDVTKLYGDTPNVAHSKNTDMPSSVAAKVCIDTEGKVWSVNILAKLERMTITDLTTALKTWRYTPYKLNGTPVTACFIVSFRTK